jgi:excinuclease ABC subunit A
VPKLAKTQKHTIDVVVDRLKVRDDMRQRLAESFETALRHAEGRAIALEMDSGAEHLFSAKFACPVCSYALQELEPRLFSFNNPMGACPKCDGLGVIQFFDPSASSPTRPSLASGAIRGWDRRNQFYFQIIESLADHYGFSVETPSGTAGERPPDHSLRLRPTAINFRYLNDGAPASSATHLRGHHPQPRTPLPRQRLDGRARGTAKYISNSPARPAPAPACAPRRACARRRQDAARDQPPAARRGAQLFQLPGADRRQGAGGRQDPQGNHRPPELPDQRRPRLPVLDRSADTLSGGEAQRIRLASRSAPA